MSEYAVHLWLKTLYTGFVLVLVPVYYVHYGLLHFLWLSDVALLLTLFALWRGSRLLNSMMAVGILPLEIAWNIDFFLLLVIGWSPGGFTDYMFDPDLERYLRLLSLFHVALPVIWIWLLVRLGYDRRALRYQLALFWSVVLTSFALTDPQDNINWVFSARRLEIEWLTQPIYLGLYLSLLPLLVFLPLHKLYSRLFA